MIALKDYQSRVLDTVGAFFKECSRSGQPDAAFKRIRERMTGYPEPYLPVAGAGLAADMPYICLRVPTGGGKTLLACHAAGLAMTDLLRAERAVVLWLVPSTTILNQTADALRDPRHPYRRALELSFGAVEVMTIDEALRLSRATADGQTVVIVSTIQAFRADDPTTRKVYEQNGAFQEHFQNLPVDRAPDLEPGPDEKPIPSLVNVLRLRRPIVIVDEAHNARTSLSFSTLGGLRPSCIVEFTATPARRDNPSNVLHHVSAAELKAAEMVKLPLRVITRDPSQKDQLLAEAIALRSDLEKLASTEAQATSEYLRPILLIQAERVDTCEPLREKITADFGVPKDQIKISVGRLDELKDIKDISASNCPVRIIITVEKLKEGWDCPFAYVLCSLRPTFSATAIEQIVGRILRLPNARSKRNPDLNCAYAFSVSDSITHVLAELRDALESNGFTAAEAERIIIPVIQGVMPLGVQPKTVTGLAEEIDPYVAEQQSKELGGKVRIDPKAGEITVYVPLSDAEVDKLASCVKSSEAKKRISDAVAAVRAAERAFGGTGETRMPSFYERQLDFLVPLLCVREGESLFEFENTFLMEHPWKLSEKDATLSSDYDPLKRPVGQLGYLDVGDRGEVQTGQLSESDAVDFVGTLHKHVLDLGGAEDWTMERLVAWLDRHIEHQDIPVAESVGFLRKAIRQLMAKHGLTEIDALGLDRFRLRDEIEQRIQQYREEEHKKAFQEYLRLGSPLIVDESRGLDFSKTLYEPSWNYEGGFRFKKHYYGPKPGELIEKTPAGALTEEFECAQFLDNLPEVAYWVRNLQRKPSSFRLQTSKDRFYPDFVCRLQDGRILVVEYKGQHLFQEAEEKRLVGEVWAARSNGKCLFTMPTARDFSIVEKLVKSTA